MNNIPDLTKYGYRVTKQLGQSKELSSFTWQGIKLSNNLSVVIKQFLFATKNSSWSAYQAYEREVELLQSLNHPAIPEYLASFETDNSFCFVRKYIEGNCLARRDTLTADGLKKIAIKVLDVLIYLQQQQPPVLHLNITPENIILDEREDIYLINFKGTRINQTVVDSSSIALANAEFIAPEQLSKPCEASDVYGLGMTLNSLIARKQISNTGIDSSFQEWLNSMTASEPNERYSDAETAKKALRSSSWDAIETVDKSSEDTVLSNRAFATALPTLAVLGSAIAIGFKVAQTATEKSFINITIAVMGAIIIYLTQSASATIITNDNAEKKQGIAVAISVPLILAIVTGFIFGRGEAVAMSLATVMAQTATLCSVLWHKLSVNRKKNYLYIFSLISAIAFGLTIGNMVF